MAGRLRVDVPSRVARCLIAPALPTFFAQYPAIALELGASDRSVDLVQENLDCALRVGPLPSSSLVAVGPDQSGVDFVMTPTSSVQSTGRVSRPAARARQPAGRRR